MDTFSKVEYLVSATVIEGRGLKGKDSQGTSDPFVKIYWANWDPQISTRLYETNNAVWNQTFIFDKVSLNRLELETMELIFEVYDYNAFMPNELIGYHSVALSTMYRSMNHEFYRTWVPLMNAEVGSDHQGYLMISWYIIGPNEKPPAHRKDAVFNEDEEELDEDMAPDISEAKKRELQDKKKGIFLLKNPQMFNKQYLLNINIVKVEGIPSDDVGTKYTTYWSARVQGNSLTSGIIKDNLSPAYNCKLGFPVYLPIQNDKIIIKLWMRVSRIAADELLANIPEIPESTDFFNISKLQGNQGRMPARWYNLYGTKPQNRSRFATPSTAYYLEGPSFLGRALISMNINPHERPRLGKGNSNLSKKPEEMQYKMYVDLNEIVNVADEAEKIWIEINWGLATTFTERTLKYNTTLKCYKFKKDKHAIKPFKMSYPVDLNQVPDIVVTMKSVRYFGGDWDIGYFRLKAKECLNNPDPRWINFKSIDKPLTSAGKMLWSFFITTSDDYIHKPRKKTGKSKYSLRGHLLYSLDIFPSLSESSIRTQIKYSIGSHEKQTVFKDGHDPIWDHAISEELDLPKDLKFAPDLTLALSRQGRLYGEEKLGEINISLDSLQEEPERPKFYQFFQAGQWVGKLLAIMYIKRYDEKGIRPDKETNNIFNKIFMNMTNADISVWIYGIRNLYKTANDPEINISLVGYALHSENVLVSFKLHNQFRISKQTKNKKLKMTMILKRTQSLRKISMSVMTKILKIIPDIKSISLKVAIIFYLITALEEDKVNPENMTKKEEPQNEDLENNLPPVNDNQAKEYIGRVITENKNSKNLKLCSLVEFKNVPFCNDPFLWPILRIEIHDTTTFSGCESLEVKVPLIKYVNFISNKEKDKSIKMLQRAYKQKKSILDKSIGT